jgi:glycerol-3-phosphate dehydrogenase
MPNGVDAYVESLDARYPELDRAIIRPLVMRHGSRASRVLGPATCLKDLGEHYGAGLYEREIDYFMQHEWAATVDDVLWRRTKAGLHLSLDQQAKLRAHMERRAVAL